MRYIESIEHWEKFAIFIDSNRNLNLDEMLCILPLSAAKTNCRFQMDIPNAKTPNLYQKWGFIFNHGNLHRVYRWLKCEQLLFSIRLDISMSNKFVSPDGYLWSRPGSPAWLLICHRSTGHKSLEVYRNYVKLDPSAVMRLVYDPDPQREKNGTKSLQRLVN